RLPDQLSTAGQTVVLRRQHAERKWQRGKCVAAAQRSVRDLRVRAFAGAARVGEDRGRGVSFLGLATAHLDLIDSINALVERGCAQVFGTDCAPSGEGGSVDVWARCVQ